MPSSLDLLKDEEDLPAYKGGEERDSQFRDVVAFNVCLAGYLGHDAASYRVA